MTIDHSKFRTLLHEMIDSFGNNVIEWSISELNDDKNKIKYSFTVFNGAFRNETLTFSFPYFRFLDKIETKKFIMHSLTSHNANYIWNAQKKKFIKQLICY